MAQPAFVELDVHKLSRDELVMLGMKEAMDRWCHELSEQAGMSDHPIVRQVVGDIQARMANVRDDITVALTRSAVRHKAGSLNNIKAEV